MTHNSQGSWRPWDAVAGWWRDNSIKARAGVVAALIVVGFVLIGALSPSGGNGEDKEASPPTPAAQAPAPPPPPPPPPSTTLTAVERSWFDDVAAGSEQLSDAMADISDKSGDPAALVTDDDVRLQFALDLSVLQSCASLLNLKKAPTSRTRALTLLPRRACRHFARASNLLARGIDNLDADLINAGAREMNAGTRFINLETQRISAFSARYGG